MPWRGQRMRRHFTGLYLLSKLLKGEQAEAKLNLNEVLKNIISQSKCNPKLKTLIMLPKRI